MKEDGLTLNHQNKILPRWHLEESDQSSSTQSEVTARRRWSNRIFTELNSIFEIIIHNYRIGLMIVGKLVRLQEEVRNEDISIALIIWEQLSTSVLFKDILETISLIPRYRTMCWLELEYSLTFITLDAHSIIILLSTMDWYLEVRSQAGDKQYSSCLLIQEMKNHRDSERIDFSLPCLKRYMHSAWKRHQDAVFWVVINLAISEGLTFYQTRSNPFILQGILLAHFLSKVEKLKTGEMLYERLFVSLTTTKYLIETPSLLD